MNYTTDLTSRLGIEKPVIVSPLSGGPTTPALVAAVSQAGAMGSLAAAYLSPKQIEHDVAMIRSLTDRPFLINLFTPMPEVKISSIELLTAIAVTQQYRDELGLAKPTLQPPYHPVFHQQFEQVIRAKPCAFSFVFGLLDWEYLDACKKEGILTIGTATTQDEALALEERGVDAVIAQGVEAGGHRAIFSTIASDPDIPALELTRLCSTKLHIPIIAAGGIMTGYDIAKALKAGAQAVMLGTAFLLCPEAGTSKPYRLALKERSSKTALTRAFSGRLARGIENRFSIEMEQSSSSILPFPAQNAFTRDIRDQATRFDKSEYISLWAGQGYNKIREMTANELIRVLCKEMEEGMKNV